LRTDYLDLYQCHIGNPTDAEVEVFLDAFERLKEQGKIRAYGISTNSLDALLRFNRHGTCATCQLDYSILNRTPERDLLPYCLEHDIGVIVRGPLAMGVLAGKFTPDTVFTDDVRRSWNEGERRGAIFATVGNCGAVAVFGSETVGRWRRRRCNLCWLIPPSVALSLAPKIPNKRKATPNLPMAS
jgi:aryl-alcohol dehydrogenase-like predicted oxidoreductase